MKASTKLIGIAALCWVGLSSADVPRFAGRLAAGADEVVRPVAEGSDIFVEGETSEGASEDSAVEPDMTSAAVRLQQAADLARQAAAIAQKAYSASDWDAVVAQWLQAIALTQSVPPESPSRIVAQRQMRGYLQQLSAAQQRAEQSSPATGLPSLGSAVFDGQLAGYLSYVATVGTPDILIVGSSRSLQGIDPQAMQQALQQRGHENLKVFNFSVNGATAQVINFMLSELLPKPLPAVVVWGDGSRAFNDGRRDRTWESLLASPGYRAIQSGKSLGALPSETPAALAANRVGVRSPLPNPAETFDALGFLSVADRFTPTAYYQQFPQVSGRYDGAYSPFALNGAQAAALASLAQTTQAQNSRLIFVNLPLSGSYLDSYRLYYEGLFQQFLQAQSQALGFDVVDLLSQWQNNSTLFADPSHINREGAAAIALQLAQNPAMISALNNQTPAEQLPAEPPAAENNEPPLVETPKP
ncbi:MAG: hypothetical protein WBA76_16205 [Phormidesmis sp.]